MTESTILVIEDEANIRSLISQQLRWEGHVVIEAANGLEGLISAEENSPDLIILDMMMPGMNGLEFLSRMGQRSGGPVSVIVMSGSLDQQIAKECMAAGVTEMLCKPFRLEALKSAVKRATNSKSQAA
jgi:CheY-like chemotaxis protein